MEKPGIEPATPGLQGIALIHYTTGAWYFFSIDLVDSIISSSVIYEANFKIILAFYFRVLMLVFIVIKSLQSMSSSVEYIIIKYFNKKC